MEKQLIIALSREYGSGGHDIAQDLAKRFSITLYDHELLDHMAEKMGVDLAEMKKYDGRLKKPFIHRTVRGMTNSPEENLAQMQFDFLVNKAKEGESFVVVGRCADSLLADYPCMVPVFVSGDFDVKLKRIMEVRKMDAFEAKKAMVRHDRERKAYHNYYSSFRWGDSRLYELCINSSKIGLEATADIIETYIRNRR